MKSSILRILERLKGTDPVDIECAMKEYVNLVDRFYHDNDDLMAPAQYREAK
jgi:hypothetical protein